MPFDTQEPQTSATPDARDMLIIALIMELEALTEMIWRGTDRLIIELHT